MLATGKRVRKVKAARDALCPSCHTMLHKGERIAYDTVAQWAVCDRPECIADASTRGTILGR